MNRLGLKLGCLAVAIVIWMQVASTATVEQRCDLPLRVAGLEEGRTVVGSALPRKVSVRLRGSKLRLLAHRWSQRPAGEVVIDLAERQPGRPFNVVLGPADVASAFTAVEVVEPTRLTVRIDGQVERRLAISLSTIGSLPAGYGLVTQLRAEPESVLVSGPARYFPERPAVRTTPLELDRLEGAGRLKLRVLPPESHLQLSTHEVEVAYSVGLLAERTIADVPVRLAGHDPGREIGVSPARVDVAVRGVADSLRILAPGRVSVTVAAGGLAEGVHLLPGEVSVPGWATVIGLDPAQFQVVVGADGEGSSQPGAARE